MPTIRVLSWNIFKFGKKVASTTTRVNVILDLVNPVAGPKFDLFVVIEPVVKGGKIESLAKGDGPDGMVKLLAALKGRSGADWQAVPPVVLASSTKKEAMAVFFDAAKLKLKGPVDDTAIKGAPWRTAKTKGAGAGTLRGKCEFVDAGGTAVKFPTGPERRPYLVTFETVSGSKAFSILAVHSPSPDYSGSTPKARNQQARKGTQALAKIKEVATAHRAHPVIVVADTNCCHGGHGSLVGYGCNNVADDEDKKARDDLTGQGFTSHITGGSGQAPGGTSLKGAGNSTATDYVNHAFDYLLTAGVVATPVTVSNVKIYGVGDLVAGYSTGLNKTKFKPLFKRIRTTAGKGVSDHLPIGADVTI